MAATRRDRAPAARRVHPREGAGGRIPARVHPRPGEGRTVPAVRPLGPLSEQHVPPNGPGNRADGLAPDELPAPYSDIRVEAAQIVHMAALQLIASAFELRND